MLATLAVAGGILAVALILGMVAPPPAHSAGEGHIAGTVTDESGVGLFDMEVDVYASRDDYNAGIIASWSPTAADGSYNVGGLPTGTYLVSFTDNGLGDYICEFYNDQRTIEDATPVAVTAGATTSGIDASLVPAGHITGTVWNADGVGLAGVKVIAYESDGSGGWNDAGWTVTGSGGTYKIGGLLTGNYRIRFGNGSGAYYYRTEYFDNQPTIDSAEDVSVTVGETTPGVNAALAPAGHITGTVTDTGGAELQGMKIHAYASVADYYSGISASWSGTDASGNYDMGDLPEGSYLVQFTDNGLGDYLAQFYNDRSIIEVADPVAVTVGATTSGINATLAPAGHITGTVMDESGAALPQMKVRASASADGPTLSWAMTAADGSYDLGGLPTGTYFVYFNDNDAGNYVAEYYSGQPTIESATPVFAVAGATTSGIDAVLAPAGHVAGTVTSASGDGLAGIDVNACVPLGFGDWYPVSWTQTAADGSYDLGGVPTGSCRIEFQDDTGGYVQQYYDGKSDMDVADDVAVTAGVTTGGIDAVLVIAGHITGTVTNESGDGLADIGIDAYRRDDSGEWRNVGFTQTAADGSYDVGVTPGDCRLMFMDDSGTYVCEYYDDKGDLDLADDISVTAGETTGGIDAVLVIAGHITGTVTDASGSGLPDISVDAFASIEDYNNGQRVAGGGTDEDGHYDLGLPGGSYLLQFSDDAGHHLTQFYDGQQAIDSADDVAATAGETTSGIDAVLALAGHVTGRVTDADGNGLGGIDVTAYRNNGSLTDWPWDWVSGSQTDEDGNYDLGGLPTGSYRIEFQDDSGAYVRQYFAAKPDIDSADDVAVTAGETASGIDASLVAGGHIAGTIRDLSGQPIPDGWLVAWRWDEAAGEWVDQAWVGDDESGAYLTEALPAGVYRIMFFHALGEYGVQVYDHMLTREAGTDVVVTVGETVPGIDADLGPVAHIEGTVTNAADEPLQGISVHAYTYEAGAWRMLVWSPETDADGAYDFDFLPGGTYRIEFEDPSGIYGPQFFDAATDVGSAEDVTVVGGDDRTGVDAVLLPADSTPPVTVADAPSGWSQGPVTVTFSATDEGSGVDYTEYSTDGGATWTRGTSAAVSAAGVTSVLYRSADKAGNVEAAKSVSVRILGAALYSGGNAVVSGSGGASSPLIDGEPSAAVYVNGRLTKSGGVDFSRVQLFVKAQGASVPPLSQFMSDERVAALTEASQAAQPEGVVYPGLTYSGNRQVTFTSPITVNGNLTISGSGSYVFDTVYVAGSVTVAGSATVSCSALRVGGSLTVSGSGTTSWGPTYVAGSASLAGSGHWNSGLFVTAGSFTASGSRTLGGDGVGDDPGPVTILMVGESRPMTLSTSGAIYGLLCNQSGPLTLSGSGTIRGSVLCGGAYAAGGSAAIVYDPEVLALTD